MKLKDSPLSDPRIIFCEPSRIWPYLGYAWKKKNQAWIAKGLSPRVSRFIAYHELYHLDHAINAIFLREQRAYAYAAIREPLGCIMAAFIVLTSWERIIGCFQEKKLEGGE